MREPNLAVEFGTRPQLQYPSNDEQIIYLSIVTFIILRIFGTRILIFVVILNRIFRQDFLKCLLQSIVLFGTFIF